MQLKFFLDCLTTWQKVVLLCLLAIRQPSWRSKNELHWCLRESFISNDLEMSFVWPWSLLDLWDTISSEPLIDDVCWHDNVRHGVVASRCLVLIDNMRDGVFEGDESMHQIGWYEVSCILLLISLLAWVLERLNARLPLTLLVACWFVRPLPMSECFYCRSFLWHLSHLSLFHSWSGGLDWVCRFIPNHV